MQGQPKRRPTKSTPQRQGLPTRGTSPKSMRQRRPANTRGQRGRGR